jgi:omega-amidase
MKNDFKLAVCQMIVVDDKDENIDKAVNMILEASRHNTDLVVLPEMFNCPYDNQKFREYSEDRNNSKTLKIISKIAAECEINIVAGSIPESEDRKIYNTSFIFDGRGDLIGSHRKLHLFDIDVPDEINFKESETLTPGDEITVLETEFCKIGVAICYDMRFPELLRLMTLNEADLIVIPGAFNMTTGPIHWECTVRSRAIDNQVFMVAASPARNWNASYVVYGHSMIVDPWGEVLAQAGTLEDIIYADIKLNRIKEIRNQLPLLRNRRTDLYEIKKK